MATVVGAHRPCARLGFDEMWDGHRWVPICQVCGDEAAYCDGTRHERTAITTSALAAVTTAEELDALLSSAFEQGEPVIVREGFRFWIITEDEDGDAWAWSWREEGEDGKPVSAHTLQMPLAVLYRPTVAGVQ